MLSWKWPLCWCSTILIQNAIGFRQIPPSTKDQFLRESFAILPQSQQPLIGPTECHELLARFPHLVSWPGDSHYDQQQSLYWSTTQSDLRPACRLTPTTSLETSQLIEYLSREKLDISITSGGHSTVLGASNLHAGVTLDLSALSEISISADNSSVSLGPGTRWIDVYKVLDPCGVTAAGGRAGSVGVGGYLLGGGISILAPRQGWSCDTLISIEVVLGNGTRVVANHTHHDQLFSSIKGGGTNFGIATTFTMSLFPAPQLQLSILQFQWDQFGTLAHEIATFVERSHQDLHASMDLSIVPDPTGKSIVGYLMATRLGSIKDSPILRPFLAIPYTHGSLDDIKPWDLAHTLDMSNPYGFRHTRCTFTIQNDLTTILAIFSAINSRFIQSDITGDDAYRPAMLLQPIYRAQLGPGDCPDKSRNALSFDNDTEPLILISFEATWSQSGLDKLIENYLTELLAHCEDIARHHDSLHTFVYPNYAGAGQDVFGSLRGQGGLDRLRAVQREYDETGYLREHVRFPFKL